MNDPVILKSGVEMPSFGLGTWRLGEDPDAAADEIAAVRYALDAGFVHIDTAEMYGDGATEHLLAKAISGRARADLFLTSKFYPWNAGTEAMVSACEASLERLGTDYLDLYLLHWPGNVPFEQTALAAEQLLSDGKIRAFGISNFDTSGLAELVDAGLADRIDVNQVMYNPARRGIEYDLLPLMRKLGIACVAYTPIEPALLQANRDFQALAEAVGMSAAQLALAWHMTRGAAVPIPKASSVGHVEDLRAAIGIQLDHNTLAEIDSILPPPLGPQPLDIL